jgi:membrane-associated protease RseP (regulator of RpoE activity)
VRQQEVMNHLIVAMDNPKLEDKLRTYSLYKSQQFFGYGIAFHTESIPATLSTHKLVYPLVEIEGNSPAEEAGMRNGQRVVAVNGEFVNKEFATLEDVVQAIEDSYYTRNFTDITVIDPELWNDCMENPSYAAELANYRPATKISSMEIIPNQIIGNKLLKKKENFVITLLGGNFLY